MLNKILRAAVKAGLLSFCLVSPAFSAVTRYPAQPPIRLSSDYTILADGLPIDVHAASTPSSWDTGGMYTVEINGRVRRAVLVEGKSERAVAQEFGIARETVRKMLRYSVPPGYRRERPVKRPKLGPWIGVIDAILEEDKNSPAKQRHTAKWIFDRLR